MRLLRASLASIITTLILSSCDEPPNNPEPQASRTMNRPAHLPKKSALRVDSPEPSKVSAPPVLPDTQAVDALVVEEAAPFVAGEPGPPVAGEPETKARPQSNAPKLINRRDSSGLTLIGVGTGGGGLSARLGGVGKVDTGGGQGLRMGRTTSVGYGRGSRHGRGGSGYSRAGVVKGRYRSPSLSAGGSRSAPAREHYTDYGTNAFVDPKSDRLSTFAADVDTGSYTVARRRIESGALPSTAAVRVEEFVNYFSYDYPRPTQGAFAVDLEAAPSPFSGEPLTYIMRVGVRAKSLDATNRKPKRLTFLVDVSGSMHSPQKLGLVKRSLKLLTSNLRQGDTIAIATYAGRVAEILPPTGMDQRRTILNAIAELDAGGSTAMNDGLKLAYRLATSDFKKGAVNRVIVLSDGDANVGPTSHEDILKRIISYVDEGVTLSTIGFGMGNYRDTLMEQLANKGNGNYYYIDSYKEARKVFGDQLDGTLQVVAKDVKFQVDFDPDVVKAYRLIGYENRDIADKDFRNDKVDAGEVGAGHRVTALYEIRLHKAPTGRLATVRVRAKKPDGHKAIETEYYLTNNDVRTSVGKASKDFQFATAVAGFAEILRASPYAKKLSYDLILEVAKASAKGRSERAEFIKLVNVAKRLAARG